MKNENRRKIAEEVLLRNGISEPIFLGQGMEGCVFHDGQYAYKVFCDMNGEKSYAQPQVKPRCIGRHFYEYEYRKMSDYLVGVRQYEKGEVLSSLSDEEAITLLVEMWQMHFYLVDIKPENCIRNECGDIKCFDCTPNVERGVTDNLFYNMCVRLFLYCRYYGKISHEEFVKLRRSAINNFNLLELDGVREFVNRVFARIIFEESNTECEKLSLRKVGDNSCVIPYDDRLNLEMLFFRSIKNGRYITDVQPQGLAIDNKNYFSPQTLRLSYSDIRQPKANVSLLIKTCAQDVLTIDANIRHIVRQLSSPEKFFEVVVSIDNKEDGFLRQYNKNPDLKQLIDVISNLQAQGVIDRFFVYDSQETKGVNYRWFGIESPFAHSALNAPISSQLFAFEMCRCDYILQMDSDVMIGRRDYNHPFLSEMLEQLIVNDKVVSVGFNICNAEDKEYFGFENGGFVPEVRMGLFDRQRIMSLCPLPNNANANGVLQLSWFRSLELAQKNSGFCSIRGGKSASFYIHPQNYRKKKSYAWMDILDRVEQLSVPALQYGHFDCEGSYRDWCAGLRNEEIVVVSVFRNVSYPRFLRMWCSLMSQTDTQFGIVLYDDCSDNGLPLLIDSLIKPYRDRVTFIKSRTRSARTENVFKSIKITVGNPDSIIVMLDGDDALIGKTVIANLRKQYSEMRCDVLVGRMHQTYRLQPHYRYPVDFCHPRNFGGNVWQHLKSFKKYLFDSIPLSYFKHNNGDEKLSVNQWFEQCDDFAFMVPIVEMSSNPCQQDTINYYYERNFEERDKNRAVKESCIAQILGKKALSPRDVFRGRKGFVSNLDKIEVDITYRCNLNCQGCNRSCGQAPTTECMSVEQIRRLIDDSIKIGKKWNLINILGGEPTLHPDFVTIINMIQNEYVDVFSANTIIQVVSNGVAEKSRELCEIVRNRNKNVRIDYDSYKQSNKVEYFTPFNDAPIDDANFADADYSLGCWVASYCGIGLNSRGYYCCAPAAGIDRVLNTQSAITSLNEVVNDAQNCMKEQMRLFCKYCGNYKAYTESGGDFVPRCEKAPFESIVSPTWNYLYKKWQDNG